MLKTKQNPLDAAGKQKVAPQHDKFRSDCFSVSAPPPNHHKKHPKVQLFLQKQAIVIIFVYWGCGLKRISVPPHLFGRKIFYL